MTVTSNNVWSRVLQNLQLKTKEDEIDAIESRVECSLDNMRRIAYECRTGKYCRPLASPTVHFNELLALLNELQANISRLVTVAGPLCTDLVSLYVTQSYTDVQRLIMFASVHLKNIPNIAKAVVDTVSSLEKLLIELKRLVVDKLKKLIEDTIKKMAQMLKDFVSSNKKAIGASALSVPLALTARTAAGATVFVGQRVLMATSAVAAVAIPVISVGTIAYKEYQKKKRLRKMENDFVFIDHCYGLKDTRKILFSAADELLEKARKHENENKTEIALIYVRGNIKIREIEDSLSCDDCKCFSENNNTYLS